MVGVWGQAAVLVRDLPTTTIVVVEDAEDPAGAEVLDEEVS